MKKLISIMLILFFVPVVFAQELTMEQEQLLAGTLTPDSPFYGIDVWWDNVKIDQKVGYEKVVARLQVMEERAYEMKVVINKNKEMYKEKAMNEYNKQLGEVEKEKLQLGEQEKLQVQNKLQNSIQVLNQVKTQLQAKGVSTQGVENAITVQEQVKSQINTDTMTMTQNKIMSPELITQNKVGGK